MGYKFLIVFKDFWIPIFGYINDFRCMLLVDDVGINRIFFVFVGMMIYIWMNYLFFLSNYLVILLKKLSVLGIAFI